MPFHAAASAQQSARRPKNPAGSLWWSRAQQQRDGEHGGGWKRRAHRVEPGAHDDHRRGGDREQAQSIEIAGPQI
jgi:hypothetical protein